jgi:hypothetical protein
VHSRVLEKPIAALHRAHVANHHSLQPCIDGCTLELCRRNFFIQKTVIVNEIDRSCIAFRLAIAIDVFPQ